jgi:hypothetical protein
MRKAIVAVIVLAVVGLSGVLCYRKGVADANAKRDAEDKVEYGNDSNSDPGVKHSAIYQMGYARGHAFGEVETIVKQTEKCRQKLADLVVGGKNDKLGAQ